MKETNLHLYSIMPPDAEHVDELCDGNETYTVCPAEESPELILS